MRRPPRVIDVRLIPIRDESAENQQDAVEREKDPADHGDSGFKISLEDSSFLWSALLLGVVAMMFEDQDQDQRGWLYVRVVIFSSGNARAGSREEGI